MKQDCWNDVIWYTLSLTQDFLFESHARAISFTQSQLFDPPTKKFYQNFGLKTSSRPFCVCKELSTTSIGRLTDTIINLLQNYIGMAIRQRCPSMKKAIEAVLFHSPESEYNDQRNFFCHRTEKSWCKWKETQEKKHIKQK